MATISLYNHTTRLFASGLNSSSHTYKVMLCSSATFDAANTTLDSVTKTEVSDGNGYTTGGAPLVNVAVTTSGNDAKFDADDVVWSVTGTGTSITASAAILYNDTATGDPPLALFDFGGNRTILTGNNFILTWDANGIFTFTVN